MTIGTVQPIDGLRTSPWFKAKHFAPPVPGWYEVRNYGAWTRRMKLISGFKYGRQMRYWNGRHWCAGWDNNGVSIMGRCVSHEFRGLYDRFAK